MSEEGLFLDVGCGAKKQPGAIGIDHAPYPGVDHVLDLVKQPLPFPDGSVGRVFSSHCIEHIADPVPVLKEMTRVCRDGARVELWHPYAFHNNAFLFDHKAFLTEEHYLHITSHQPRYWAEQLGGWWQIEEIVFAIAGDVVAELDDAGVDVDFAVKYLQNVVTEIGVFARIDKLGAPPETAPPPRRLYAVSRAPADRRPIVRPATRRRSLREHFDRLRRSR